ncbi:hypothetical protein X973_08450 [Piscirickettsia salmonis]|nr:hypothetical protein X973_08450 [Piscirickettsia salmonis]WGZ72841.1 hypothetical protein E3220_15510 [Piscirickettsia salmonis EM-90]
MARSDCKEKASFFLIVFFNLLIVCQKLLIERYTMLSGWTFCLTIGNHLCIHFTTSLENPSCSISASLTFACVTKVAFIEFNFPTKLFTTVLLF